MPVNLSKVRLSLHHINLISVPEMVQNVFWTKLHKREQTNREQYLLSLNFLQKFCFQLECKTNKTQQYFISITKELDNTKILHRRNGHDENSFRSAGFGWSDCSPAEIYGIIEPLLLLSMDLCWLEY